MIDKMLAFAKMAYETPTISALQIAKAADSSVEFAQFFDFDDTQFYIVIIKDKAIISFRGTSSIGDAFDDARAHLVQFCGLDMKVHMGFNKQFECAWPTIKDFLNNHPYQNVHFVGHSLGGALATIAACASIHYLSLKPSVHTFGSPRVGDAKFAKYFNAGVKETKRYVNGNDAVTYVPWFFFVHVDGEVAIGSKRYDPWSAYFGRVDDHHIANYAKALSF